MTRLLRVARTAAGAAGAVLAGLLLVPAAAFGHAGSQPIPDAAYYQTTLTAIEPVPAGLRVRVDPAGEWIELGYAGPAEVIVLGYVREPYLRVTASSAQENQLSQTTYINTALFTDALPTAAPAGTDPGAVAPSWRQIGSTGTVRWHDHRIHWMGQSRPPVVAADPRHAHQVGTWSVHAVAAGTPVEIRGELRWIGKPDSANASQPIPEWLLALIEAVVVAAAVLGGVWWRQRIRRAGRGRWSAILVDEPPVPEPSAHQPSVQESPVH